MNRRKVIFRADGSPEIGMGHVTRTLALANMLRDNFKCIFVTRSVIKYKISEISRIFHDLVILPDNNEHLDQFLELLHGDEIVVLDNYFFTTEYQLKIKNLGCDLVCIDDLHDKHYVADIVINHTEGVLKEMFSAESYTKLLLGFKYALLQGHFLSKPNSTPKKKYDALVIMGGADQTKITDKILGILRIRLQDFQTIAIVGTKELKKDESSENQNVEHFKSLRADQIKHLMQVSRIGIFPASTVSIEACSVGIPFICGYFVDNQKILYSALKKNNLAICIGNFNDINIRVINRALDFLGNEGNIKQISQNQRKFFDYNSGNRLKKEFLKL